MSSQLRCSDILSSELRIRPYVAATRVISISKLNQKLGCEVYFKCENEQHSGSFKFRGAVNLISALSEDEAERGIVTHSSGNCGLAMALAARSRNVPCYVVVPKNISPEKRYLLQEYGAFFEYSEPTLESRRILTKRLAKEKGLVYIDPFEDLRVIAAQGTAAIELMRDVSDLNLLMAPVGSGGLLASCLVAVKTLKPGMRVIGCEPALAPDAFQSVRTGQLVEQCAPETVCDGLRTNLGQTTFNIISKIVDSILLAQEDTILEAVSILQQEFEIAVEASAGVPLAVVMENRAMFAGQKVGIILTGGNSPESVASRAAAAMSSVAV